jgi:hypothetical protein
MKELKPARVKRARARIVRDIEFVGTDGEAFNFLQSLGETNLQHESGSHRGWLPLRDLPFA